ncbi:Heterokaryon incompatibility protein 6 like [Verticillium longisporum]|uniref:Heterokaryon incompatibility protein 6 like n=1 Tax=Verticillium longisporum TaxID=100787 RepID=A0A8I2ZRP4_VERLO|nr:Heterokaryon incompatibility protein 6 like [Verticillium longisporum]
MATSIKRTIQAGALALKRHRDGRHFKYSHLSIHRRQIRILVLSPGRYNDELRAEVRFVNIDDPHHLRYEAVSHSCAVTTGDLKPIKVGTTRRLWVQPTIAVMLQHLRYQDENRALWIDQLCINQDDLVEKSAQALMVTDVFKAADRAVVWLGPEGADSSNAFSLLEDLGWMVEFDFDNMRMRPSAAGIDEPSWADPKEELPYDQDGVWSVYELIYRTWFGRVSSRQEIAAKPANATVVCGFRTISWDLLRTALGCFANKPRAHLESPDSPVELRFARRYDMILLLCQTNKVYDLCTLLEQSRLFSCPNPLDRIYSVLSLAVNSDPFMGLTPNYELSKTELYLDTTFRHINYTKTTNILASCEGASVSLAASEMPSWVPDWSRKRRANAMPLHFASSHSEARVQIESNILHAHAIQCGTVKSTVDLFSDYVPVLRALAAIRRCAPLDVLTSSYNGQCSLLEAYCATLAWGLFDCLHSPPVETYPNSETSTEALRRLLATPTDPVSLGSAAQAADENAELQPKQELEDPRLVSLRTKLREADVEATFETTDDLLEPSILRAAGINVQDIQLV